MLIKKVKTSKLKSSFGTIIDSLNTTDDASANAPSIRAIKEYIDGLVGSGGAGGVIGQITPFAGSTAPEGYLVCDGSAVLRSTYADLFAVIGTTYGAGDGTLTFNLPNLKGKTLVGYNKDDTNFNTLGKTGGVSTNTLAVENIPSHNHSFTGTAHNHSFTGSGHTHTLNGHTHSFSATSGNQSAGHTHSVGAHAHGLNGHTHSIPALSGTAASAGAHSHSIRYKGFSGMNQSTGGYMVLRRNESADSYDGTDGDGAISAGAHTHSVSTSASTTGGNSGSTANSGAFNTGGISANHTHSISGTTGANSGNTSSTTQGGTVGNATQGGTVGNTGSGTAFSNLQPYAVINYIIKAK